MATLNTINNVKRQNVYFSISSSSVWHLQPLRVSASLFLRLRYHTEGHITVGRTPLDE